MDFTSISANYGQSKAEINAAKSRLAELESKERSLRSDFSEAEIELARLLDLEQNDHVKRVLDGDEAAPRKPKRLTSIANLREQIEGFKLAFPIHEQRVTDARRSLRDAEEKAGEAILPAILKQKAELFQACSEPLETLLSALIEVAAFDDVQQHFARSDGGIIVGKGIESKNLFSARAILAKFQRALPDRFKALAEDTLLSAETTVANRSKAIISQIGAQQ